MEYTFMTELSDPLHFSNLKHFARSAAHYRSNILEPRAQSPAMRLGSAVHAVVLEQPFAVWQGKRAGYEWKLIEARVAGTPYVVWNGARRGAAWKSFAESNPESLIVTTEELDSAHDRIRGWAGWAGLGQPNLCILSEAEYERARRCADSIGTNSDAARMLNGPRETAHKWQIAGRKCVGRIDCTGNWSVTELKSCASSEPGKFVRDGLRMGYHAQLAWYLDGIGHPDWDAHVVAVEPVAPYAVSIFTLTRRALEEGRKAYRLWLEQLLVCEQSDQWPPYSQCVNAFDTPDEYKAIIFDDEDATAIEASE